MTVNPICEFALMFYRVLCLQIPLMFAEIPDSRLALSMTFLKMVSAPVLLIVASPDTVWFFHPGVGSVLS